MAVGGFNAGAMARCEDDRQERLAIANAAMRLDAVDARKTDVEKHDVGLEPLDRINRFFAAGNTRDFEVRLAQQRGDPLDDDGLVLDHQQLSRSHWWRTRVLACPL